MRIYFPMLLIFVILSLSISAGCAQVPSQAPATQDEAKPTSVSTQPAPQATNEDPTVEAPTETEQAALNALVKTYSDFMSAEADQKKFSGSIILVRHGEIILSQGYGFADQDKQVKNTPQTRFRIGSITKQFTAAAIMQLKEAGKLQVDDLICKYLKDCPDTWSQITIKQLLNHSAGIVSYTDLEEYWDQMGEPQTPEQLIGRFNDKPLLFEPGSKWDYSNSNYAILGYLIEQLSGMPYDEYITKHIFIPLGMSNSGYDHNDPSLAIGYNYDLDAPAEYIHMSTPYAAGGLFSTAEDLYKWDRALYTDAVLSKASIAEMTAPTIMAWEEDNEYYGYGLSVWDKGEGRYQIGHDGYINGFTGLILRYPNTDSAIIVLTNQEEADLGTIVGKIIEVFGEFYE